MEPVGLAASIVTLTKLTKDVLSVVKEAKDASAERKSFIREICGLSGQLNTLIELINQAGPADTWLHAVYDLTATEGPLHQYSHALLNIKAKVAPGSSMRKLGQALTWKVIKDDINSLLSQIERVKSLVAIALEMDQMKLSHAIKEDLEIVRSDMTELKSGSLKIQDDTSFLRSNVSATQKQSVLDWLCPTDYSQQHRDIINRRTPGTGDWFLNTPEFQTWEQSADGTLFCPGDPGVGKTIMSAIVVERLLRTLHPFKQPVVFIYFNYKQQGEQTRDYIVRSFLRQIADFPAGVPKAVMEFRETHEEKRTTPNSAEFEQLLETVIIEIRGLSIVTDALDESDDTARAGLFRLVKDLRAHTKARYLATSRNYPAITSHDLFLHQPSLEIKATAKDLERYLQDRFVGFKAKPTLELQGQLISGVIAAVGGMFLLARLLMDSFQDKIRIKSIKEDLAKLPTGLAAYDVAYDNAMERIQAQPQELRDCATKALSLIMCAKRPLRTSEITYALMLEPGDSEIDEDNELDIEVIIASSAALLTVDEESQTVRFVHYTTQEYLQRMKDKWLPRAEAAMVSMCTVAWEVAYHRKGVGIAQLSEFDSYASKYGLGHFDAVLNDSRYVECDHTEVWMFLQDTARVDAAMPQDLLSWSLGTHRTRKTGAHWSASLGLTGILKNLISKGFDVDQKDYLQRTPLMDAARHGQHGAISLLLRSNKVNVNAVDLKSATALMLAIDLRHVEAVRTLLTESSEICLNHKAESGHSALHRAVLGASSQPNTHSTTPQEANPPMDILKLLIDTKGLEIDSRDGDGRTVLSFASTYGSKAALKLILESGKVDVNSRDREGLSPLLHAASGGREAVVSLLVSHGATVDLKCDLGIPALHYAARNGEQGTVRLLLELGAAVDFECYSRVKPSLFALPIISPGYESPFFDAWNKAESKSALGLTPLFRSFHDESEWKRAKDLHRNYLSSPDMDLWARVHSGRALFAQATAAEKLTPIPCEVHLVPEGTPLSFTYNSVHSEMKAREFPGTGHVDNEHFDGLESGSLREGSTMWTSASLRSCNVQGWRLKKSEDGEEVVSQEFWDKLFSNSLT